MRMVAEDVILLGVKDSGSSQGHREVSLRQPKHKNMIEYLPQHLLCPSGSEVLPEVPAPEGWAKATTSDSPTHVYMINL